MKKTEGFVTDDGTFFENQMEAALHEAESLLRTRFAAMDLRISADEFLAVVFETMPELKGYIDAHFAAGAAKLDQAEEQDRAEDGDSRTAKADGGIGHVSSTEEDLAALLKLPPRGHSNVSNVGSSPRPKKVQERRAKHGS